MFQFSIQERVETLQTQIKPSTLLVVTKKRSVKAIREVISAGIKDIGENTLQEIQKKYDHHLFRELQQNGVRLHYLGHLQTKKIRQIVRLCDVIHSVDSLGKAEKVNQAAADLNKIIPIFLELNLTGEEQKHGIVLKPSSQDEDQLELIISEIKTLPNLKLLGLMCIGKIGDEQKSREIFRKCKSLAERYQLHETSMGMSDDYKTALEEGSTLVRLGRVIFE
jgi:pyridoxal phosphate enzyme (YggS family)